MWGGGGEAYRHIYIQTVRVCARVHGRVFVCLFVCLFVRACARVCVSVSKYGGRSNENHDMAQTCIHHVKYEHVRKLAESLGEIR